MRVVEYDPKLPHQIRIIVEPRKKTCLDGSEVGGMRLAVSCNCHFKAPKGFRNIIAAIPEGDEAVAAAWRAWNNPDYHREVETFEPNAAMLERYGRAWNPTSV